jgi:glycerol-3-phosphate dehydrogenase
MLMRNESNDKNPIDLLVIGGGINGTGIARDAAGRGLRVILCEKDDLAAHTSSASTKLIHGGLRYLENYDFLLVRHSLQEREVLLRSAPHIIWPLRFILPHHSGLRPRWMLRLGLFLYDHIGGRKILPASNSVNLKKHVAGQFLKTKFTCAFEYSDCWVQDARLVVLNARDAEARGADILTHTECIDLQRHSSHWAVTLLNKRNGVEQTVNTRAIVNASGPWVDKTLGLYNKTTHKRSVRLVKGSHVIVKKLFQHPYPYIFQNNDGRIIFAIPFEQEFTLLGTTDHDFKGDLNQVKIDAQEIDYICQAVSEYTADPVTSDQVVWSYSGVRPLFDDASDNASKVTRDYVLDLDTEGAPVVSVYGGKVTTYRKLSEQVLDHLQQPLKITNPSWTVNSILPGGDIPQGDFGAFVTKTKNTYEWLDENILYDYCRNYGTEIDTLLENRESVKEMGEYFGGGLYECEVNFLMRHEWAYHSDDILWRRSKKGLRLTEKEVEHLQQWMSENYTKYNSNPNTTEIIHERINS